MTTLGLTLYTKRSDHDPLSALLRRTATCDVAGNGEPFPDAGRWRPTCVAQIPDDLSEDAVRKEIWSILRTQLGWGYAGSSKAHLAIGPEKNGLWMWGMLAPYAAVQGFRVSPSWGYAELFTREQLGNVVAVKCTQFDSFDWNAQYGMKNAERHMVLEGFSLFS